ncbi:MAG TPA: PCMD domain-containing protein [Bacteroidales bacterium]|nr:PCMD domain-containing protein [Bacteroidales bacterium]HOL99144.1 PCMD domain-containing protein [Bacteroidales bacterium]HOM36821.1 PCMD domain-containing protein [Bacteroidales bacterium]HPD24577.1 PCMD domain-containing protein [Bacteroidales bacterium]HRS99186.1 PCMD domain-containing protein [Bacteroidales bacterium]
MKNIIVIPFLFFVNFLFSQNYNIINGGFENWDSSSTDAEPVCWNGFTSADCSLFIGCGSATQARHSKSTDVRPGSTGLYSLKIFATSTLGIIANGTITTGKIKIGSTNPNHSSNYNVTLQEIADFNHPLNSKPDSLVFWAKFICPSETQTARVSAVIHDNYNYRDPEDSQSSQHVVAKAVHNFTRETQNWRRFSIPFDYNFPSNNPKYILLTFTTNSIAGEGSTNDALFIDDVELIYNTLLNSITINGVNLENFNPNNFTYEITSDCGVIPNVSATAQSQNATVSIQGSEDNKTFQITVISGNQNSNYIIIVNYINEINFIDSICSGETYIKNGFEIITSTPGNFIYYTNSISETCDTLKTLQLTVFPNYPQILREITICNSSSYYFDNQYLSEPGIYYEYHHTANNCDSIIKLVLSVDNFYQINFNAEICEGEVYIQNGFNESTTGTYTNYYTAINCCDSLVILYLTVNPNDLILLYDSIPVNQMYTKFGFNIEPISEEDLYLFSNTFSNIYGCDSVISLILKVYNIPETEKPPFDKELIIYVYPSPTKDILTIKIDNYIDEIFVCRIFNTNAQKIDEFIINASLKIIDISNFYSGTYLISLYYNEKNFFTKKIIINN